MKKTNLISGFAIIMLLLNIGLVFFIWNKKPNHPMHEGPKQLIIETLHFNEEQVQAYELLVEDHKEASQSKKEQIGTLKDALYQTLLVRESVEKDSILLIIDKVKHEMEELNYNHFKDIKMLCNADQMEEFEVLAGELSKLFNPDRPGMKKEE